MAAAGHGRSQRDAVRYDGRSAGQLDTGGGQMAPYVPFTSNETPFDE